MIDDLMLVSDVVPVSTSSINVFHQIMNTVNHVVKCSLGYEFETVKLAFLSCHRVTWDHRVPRDLQGQKVKR